MATKINDYDRSRNILENCMLYSDRLEKICSYVKKEFKSLKTTCKPSETQCLSDEYKKVDDSFWHFRAHLSQIIALSDLDMQERDIAKLEEEFQAPKQLARKFTTRFSNF